MIERCPTKGVNEVRLPSGGIGVVGAVIGIFAGFRNAGSNASPGMKWAGNVSGVDLKSLWPSSQNSMTT